MIDEKMAPRRPVLVDLPDDTWFGDRNALWLIDGNIFPKPAGMGSYHWSRHRRKRRKKCAAISP